MRNHDGRAYDDSFTSLDGGSGIPGKRTRSEGLAGGFGGGAPILQFKPSGDGARPAEGESYLDDILGHRAEARAKPGEKPEWMSPDSNTPLPGEPVPGYGPGHKYTEDDKANLRVQYNARSRANKAEVGKFLREYVDAAVTIMAKYVKGSVKEKDQVHAFLKFVVAESLASLAGGIGSKIAKEGLEFLASKVTDFGIGAALEDDETFEDEKNMDKLIAVIGATTGTLAEGMVTKMEDGFDAGMWLGAAKVEQLHRFRIPERFLSPPRDKIRGTVAGMVGGAHHRRVIGGQMGSGLQWMQVNDVEATDHNVVVVHVGVSSGGKAHVKSARINSRNKELPKEINGKVDIGTLSAMALHVTVDPNTDRLNPAAKIMKALRHPEVPAPDDVVDFEQAYPKNGGTFTYTRNTKGAFASQGEGTLADHLMLYQLATDDHELHHLSEQVNGTESDDQSRTTRPRFRTPAELAQSTYDVFKIERVGGGGPHALQTAVVDKARPQ